MLGFTLLELLITCAIIMILSVVTVPVYTHYFTQERRLEAEMTLNKLALALEQYYLMHQTYQGASLNELHFPELTPSHHHRIMIDHLSETEFKLAAIPEDAEKDLACGTLMINSNGEKNITGTSTLEDCW